MLHGHFFPPFVSLKPFFLKSAQTREKECFKKYLKLLSFLKTQIFPIWCFVSQVECLRETVENITLEKSSYFGSTDLKSDFSRIFTTYGN